jgi:signal transduction histidine kinase/predicted transcriptional regulator
MQHDRNFRHLHLLEQANQILSSPIAESHLSECAMSSSLDPAKLANIVDKNPLIVSPNLSIELAIGMMQNSCALVVENSQLVGIFTTKDALRAITKADDWRSISVGLVMTQKVIAIAQNDLRDIVSIANLMRQHHIHYLPVLDQHHHPIGLITGDIICRVFDSMEVYTAIAGDRAQLNDETLTLVSDINECQQTETALRDSKLAEVALRQQIEREQLVGAITRRVRKSLNLAQILNTTVEQLCQVLQADRVLVYQIARNGTGCVIAESIKPGWSSILDTCFPSEAFPSDCLQRYLEGHITYIADCKSEPILPCMSQMIEDFQIRAMLIVPIVQEESNRLWGLLIVHQCSNIREWQAWELTLQLQLADQLAIATKQSELYQQLQLELKERKRAEEQLRQTNDCLALTNEQLARATRSKDEFLSNMSHELRTPLNAILGISEGLLDEGFAPLTDKQKKAIRTIEKSGKHLLELINDILDLAKIEAGKLELCFTSVAIASLCDSSMGFIKRQASKKNITLKTKILDGAERSFMDERRMRQVLINLLSNAVKFTPDGGDVTLEVSVNEEDRKVMFCVRDTGIGIASEDKHKLFKTFVQIDSSLSRRHDGTGLGLALVRRIVELHSGSVRLESEVGQGSQFMVTIPLW